MASERSFLISLGGKCNVIFLVLGECFEFHLVLSCCSFNLGGCQERHPACKRTTLGSVLEELEEKSQDTSLIFVYLLSV